MYLLARLQVLKFELREVKRHEFQTPNQNRGTPLYRGVNIKLKKSCSLGVERCFVSLSLQYPSLHMTTDASGQMKTGGKIKAHCLFVDMLDISNYVCFEGINLLSGVVQSMPLCNFNCFLCIDPQMLQMYTQTQT